MKRINYCPPKSQNEEDFLTCKYLCSSQIPVPMEVNRYINL